MIRCARRFGARAPPRPPRSTTANPRHRLDAPRSVTTHARRLVESDDLVFEEELERRFGHKLGALKVVGGRRAFPLGLTLARAFVAPRFALAGDAAHGIHPISGQGLNLGFKDVAALAETIVEADRLGLDIGALSALERYETWRRFDTVRMGMTTDVLNRLFSNDVTPLRVLRDVGLGVVDRLPGLKSFFIRQAEGTTGGMRSTASCSSGMATAGAKRRSSAALTGGSPQTKTKHDRKIHGSHARTGDGRPAGVAGAAAESSTASAGRQNRISTTRETMEAAALMMSTSMGPV